MTIEELIIYGKKYLSSDKVNMLLGYILNYNNLELHIHLNEVIQESLVEKYKEMIEKIKNNIPIQYVLGNVNFYGNEFIVNENVLIPRFETEELVENTIKYINNLFDKETVNIIDLGSGSGNIGITLKKKLIATKVTCVDISEDALEAAKENANRLETDITFKISDMLDNIEGKFDVIISNPPYIDREEEIEDIVKNNEPHLALFADNKGLYFYEKILSTCKKNLEDKFLIAFEIGMTQKDAITELANKYLKNIKVDCKKDLSGKDRMIFIYNI